MKNKSVLQALAVDDTISISLLKPIKLILLDDSKFWENVLIMLNLLTLIVNAISVLESNHNLNHRVRSLLNAVELFVILNPLHMIPFLKSCLYI